MQCHNSWYSSCMGEYIYITGYKTPREMKHEESQINEIQRDLYRKYSISKMKLQRFNCTKKQKINNAENLKHSKHVIKVWGLLTTWNKRRNCSPLASAGILVITGQNMEILLLYSYNEEKDFKKSEWLLEEILNLKVLCTNNQTFCLCFELKIRHTSVLVETSDKCEFKPYVKYMYTMGNPWYRYYV